MKRLVAVIMLLAVVCSALAFSGCGNAIDDVFVPDAELRSSAEGVLASLGQDRRIDEYLKIRPSLEAYKTSTRRAEIRRELEELKKVYSGIDSELSFDRGAKAVNEQLFNYLVEGTYYYKAQFDEALIDSDTKLKEIVSSLGYNLAYEFQNNGGQIGMKYYYGNGQVHDDLNYYSICSLSDGKVEYISLPVFYEPLTEAFVEGYAAKSADERKVVFDESVKYYAEKADICNNPVLKLIYSNDELNMLSDFIDSLDVEYLDEHNLSTEEEPYSNRQIAVELGSTRFILRVTIYGMFMDVIQNKDYYVGSFYKGLETLRRAYLGTEPASVKDDKYIVVGA